MKKGTFKINTTKKNVLIIFLTLLCSNTFAQSFNTEAISKLWEITDTLKKDKELSDALWLSYYNLKGNKDYIENNRGTENVTDHRRFLELFFRPSLADSLEKALQSEQFKNNDIFQNLVYIKDNEKQLKEYTKVIASPDYLEHCIALSKAYLPKGKYEVIPKELIIYIQGFTYDAATQGNSVYFGISVIHDIDKLRKGVIAAHELHHVLRKNRTTQNVLSAADSASYAIINQINNEGIADLIDKELVVTRTAETLMGSMFKEWLLGSAEEVVTKLDTSFLVNAAQSDTFMGKTEFRKITNYSSGHVPGYYMMAVIKRNGYVQEAVDNSDNPFSFFYIYHKAAKKDEENPVMFSEAAMKYIKELEIKAYKPQSVKMTTVFSD